MATLSVAQSGYAETGTGYVTATPGLGAAQLKAAFQYDLTGRQITQIEYTGDGTGYAGSGYGYFYNVPPSSIANYRYSYYDNAGRVTRTLDIARQGSDTIQTDTTNQYGANQYGVTTAGYGRLSSQAGVIERHHMPPNSLHLTTEYSGPAIQMDYADHLLTSSHTRAGLDGKLYRAEIQGLIDSGNMRGAMAQEIWDVRRAAAQGGGSASKYNGATREMLEYTYGKGWITK